MPDPFEEKYGKPVMTRLTPSLHNRLRNYCQMSGLRIREFMEAAIQEKMRRDDPDNQHKL